MIRRILVPLDGSPLAEGVLPHAKAVARAFNAEIILLGVLEPGTQSDRSSVDSAEWRLRKNEAGVYFERVVSRLRDAGQRVRVEFADGDPPEEIVSYAREHEVDLVVLSTHGSAGASDFGFGGTAASVLARAGVSLLIIRATTSRLVSSQDPEVRYERLVVPVDGSILAEWALCLAATLARAHHSELLIVYVVQVPSLSHSQRIRPALADSQLVERVVEVNRLAGEAYLRDMQAMLDAKDLQVRTELLVSAQVPLAIHQLVERERAGLLVLSAHGSSGPAPWPYGSVASNLISYATVPVLIFQDLPRAARCEPGASSAQAGREPALPMLG